MFLWCVCVDNFVVALFYITGCTLVVGFIFFIFHVEFSSFWFFFSVLVLVFC